MRIDTRFSKEIALLFAWQAVADVIPNLYPWHITDVYTSTASSGSNGSISFLVSDPNTIPGPPSDSIPNTYPHFNKSQAACSVEWNSTTVWGSQGFLCDGWTEDEAFHFLLPNVHGIEDTLQLTSTLTLNISRTMQILFNDTYYHKNFSAQVHFQSSEELKGGCDSHSGICTWSLKGSHTPTLVNQDMVSCDGDCYPYGWGGW
jgi:hypothetical protein